MNQTMNACVLHAPKILTYESVALPTVKDDEVLVKIKNCGVCGSDIGRILKTGTYRFPTIPGHEFAGEVVSDAAGTWQNKRVAVFPLIPCRKCDMCAKKAYAQCRQYDYYGSRRDGGFAEYLAVKKANLIELPENVSFEEGAMCEPISVAHHAVKKLHLSQGDRLLITGAGPIGLLAGMWARSFGVKDIFFVDIDKRKLDFAEQHGFCRYDGDEGITAVLEGTGASSALTTAVNAVDMFGRVVLMGNPSREVTLEKAVYQTILRKELQLAGTWNSAFSDIENDWKASLSGLSNGILSTKRLITHRIALQDVFSTVQAIADGSDFFCKVMAEM